MSIFKNITHASKNLNTHSSDKIKEALNQVLSKSSESQFHDVVHRSHLFESSQKLGLELKQKYTQFVIVGIGGSSMGARCLCEVTHTENIYFLDNVDSHEFNHIWNKIKSNLNSTGFIYVSKSGSTVEILWNISTLENLFQQQTQKSIYTQSYFVSELTQNPLAQLARKHERPLLEVPLDIGGRFSVLTPVGLLIAELCNLNLNDLKEGAAQSLKDHDLLVSQCSTFLESFDRNENISLFWFYNSNMRWFGGWLQQLWAESLGKKQTRQNTPAPLNSTPMMAIGASDQHSILQQVAHGPHDKFVTFFTFDSVENSTIQNKNLSFSEIEYLKNKNYGDLIKYQSLSTFEALKMNEVSSQLIAVDDSNLSLTLGYLFMFYQTLVGLIGTYQNINPFDQPGVTLGKDLTIKKFKEESKI